MNGRVALLLATAGTMCGPQAAWEETVSEATPSGKLSSQGQAANALAISGQRELEEQLDLYMFAMSDAYRSNSIGPYHEQWGTGRYQLMALGLLARTRLESAGEPAVAAVTGRLPRARGGNGDDSRWVLLGLLTRLGVSGTKALLSHGPYFAPASDKDAAWIHFLRGEGEYAAAWGPDGRRGYDHSRLWWQLTRDPEALVDIVASLDEDIALFREMGAELAQTEDEATDGGMRGVLAIAPVEGGVPDTTLARWQQQGYSPGLRWGADLALARRGDEAAQARVRSHIKRRFTLQQDELEWQKSRKWSSEAAFTFTLELAETTTIEDRWSLLIGLLGDSAPRLLPARVAALIALKDHGPELDSDTQRDVHRAVVEQYQRETDSWLRAMMMTAISSRSWSEALDP